MQTALLTLKVTQKDSAHNIPARLSESTQDASLTEGCPFQPTRSVRHKLEPHTFTQTQQRKLTGHEAKMNSFSLFIFSGRFTLIQTTH